MNIVEKLEKHYEIKEGDACELIEALMSEEDLEVSIYSEHRWHQVKQYVVKAGETYVRYCDYYVTGDMGWSEMGLEYDDLIEYIEEVEPIEVKTIKYRAL